jgi:hypothetical protein
MAERCDEVRRLVPELALGVAPGDERARALLHIESCTGCRAVLERAAATADDLLLLAPEHEPPIGFDTGVLRAMQAPRRRRRTTALLAAAAVLVAGLGAAATTWGGRVETTARWRGSTGRPSTSATAAPCAPLPEDRHGSRGGHVFAYQGEPSWVFMTVDGAPSGYYGVTMVTDDGAGARPRLVHGAGRHRVMGRGRRRSDQDRRPRRDAPGGTILTAQFQGTPAG